MGTIQFLFILFLGVLLFINRDLVILLDFISFKLYEGKRKAPRETSFR